MRRCCSSLLVACLMFAAVGMACIPSAPVDLKLEYLSSPVLGVDVPNPRLGWTSVVSDVAPIGRGCVQSAYEVSLVQLVPGPAHQIWSVVANSSLSRNVPIEIALPDESKFSWRVRWATCGQWSEWSENATFTTSFANATQALQSAAAWIGGFPQLRTTFSLPKSDEVVLAQAYIAGIGFHELYANGAKADPTRLFGAAWTAYPVRTMFVTYDLTALLQSGAENALGVMLGGGWWQQGWGQSPRLLALLTVRLASGRVLHLGSSPNLWTGAAGPITFDSIYDGETYNAALETPGWTNASFDPSPPWSPAQLLGPPKDVSFTGPDVSVRLQSQLIYPVEILSSFPARTMYQVGNQWIFDFGQNFAGFVTLQVSGPPGTNITLQFAEVLYANGTLDRRNLRSAKATDYYALAGDSSALQTYTPRFTYHGFRFVSVSGFPGVPTLSTLLGRQISDNNPDSGMFSLSPVDHSINRVVSNTRWGHRSNMMMGVPTDCPQRDERLGWMADAHLAASSSFLFYDVPAFYQHWLQLIVDDMIVRGNGTMVSDTSPQHINWNYGNTPADPAWGAALPELIVLMLEHYNDTRIAAQLFPHMRAWVDYLVERFMAANADAYYGYYGDWCPPSPAPRANVSFTSGFYMMRGVRQVAAVAAVLGHKQEATSYQELFARLSKRFLPTWVDFATGVVDIDAQCDYALMLAEPMVSPDSPLIGLMQERLLAAVQRADNRLTTGILGTRFLLTTLADMGQIQLAMAIINASSSVVSPAAGAYPGWVWPFDGQTFEAPATTLWELWDSPVEGDSMNSRNHIMFGTVSLFLFNYLGGLRQSTGSVGWAQITAEPPSDSILCGGAVTAAATSVQTRIVFDWSISCSSPSAVELNVTAVVPVGASMSVFISTFGASPQAATILETNWDGAQVVWNQGTFVPTPGIASALATTNSYGDIGIVFSVSAGAFSFVYRS